MGCLFAAVTVYAGATAVVNSWHKRQADARFQDWTRRAQQMANAQNPALMSALTAALPSYFADRSTQSRPAPYSWSVDAGPWTTADHSADQVEMDLASGLKRAGFDVISAPACAGSRTIMARLPSGELLVDVQAEAAPDHTTVTAKTIPSVPRCC